MAIKSFRVEKLCATKANVCPCSLQSQCCLWNSCPLPPSVMFSSFSSQERPVLLRFHVLHLCMPGGGSSLQTSRWCTPSYGYEWSRALLPSFPLISIGRWAPSACEPKMFTSRDKHSVIDCKLYRYFHTHSREEQEAMVHKKPWLTENKTHLNKSSI